MANESKANCVRIPRDVRVVFDERRLRKTTVFRKPTTDVGGWGGARFVPFG